MEYSFLRYFLFFSYVIQRPILPQISLITQRECSKLHYFADKRQLPHSGDNAVHVYATKLWGEHAHSFLALPLHVNGQFSRRFRWLRRGNAASCIISQTKDSYLIVETMQFMFIQQSCEGTCSFIPCSSLTCERPILPQIPLITQRECSKLHYFADKRQLPHSGDNAVHVYTTKLWGNTLALSLFIPCSLLVHSSLFPYMWTAYSPADLADLRR